MTHECRINRDAQEHTTMRANTRKARPLLLSRITHNNRVSGYMGDWLGAFGAGSVWHVIGIVGLANDLALAQAGAAGDGIEATGSQAKACDATPKPPPVVQQRPCSAPFVEGARSGFMGMNPQNADWLMKGYYRNSCGIKE
jgi:hypothetical protein